MKILSWLFLFGAMILARPARAYLVGPAPNLASLNASSSLVVKVTALASQNVEDASFQDLASFGFVVNQTRFRVVSVLKDDTNGVALDSEIEFRHYAPTSEKSMIYGMYVPHYYRFAAGRSYLLWAKKSDANWRQFSTAPTFFQQQGALLTPDDAPVEGDIKEVIWQQTNALLRSVDAKDQISAIQTLRAMSSASGETRMDGTGDFKATAVLDALAPFIESPDGDVAYAAILASKLGAARVAESILVATRAANVRTRVAALEALSAVETGAVENRARAAVIDPAPQVVAAALRLLANFPGETTRATWQRATRSDNAILRAAVADAIRTSLDETMLPTLGVLIDDANAPVSEAAANAMLSFSKNVARPWWQKERAHPQWGSVFVVALAETDEHTAPYVPALTRIVAQNLETPNVSYNGLSTVHQSWKLLFDFLGQQPRARLTSGEFDALYDNLEHLKNFSGSSEPEELYRFYRENGLDKRAHTFRTAQEQTSPYMKPYFERADTAIKTAKPRGNGAKIG